MTVLEKRTYDERTYDVDCVDLLGESEVWTSIASITSDHPHLVFGTPVINAAPITYPDPNGHTSAAGKVVQFSISGGVLGVRDSYIDCVVRVRGVTNQSPALEATVTLRLKDNP